MGFLSPLSLLLPLIRVRLLLMVLLQPHHHHLVENTCLSSGDRMPKPLHRPLLQNLIVGLAGRMIVTVIDRRSLAIDGVVVVVARDPLGPHLGVVLNVDR